MKTIIIGGGNGCKEILSLSHQEFLKQLNLNIVAVVDIEPNAPGIKYASELGIKTYTSWEEATKENDYEMIIELTGSEFFLNQLYKKITPGIRLIDHRMAHVFWDLIDAQLDRDRQYDEVVKLQNDLRKEQKFLQDIFDSYTDLAVIIDFDRRIVRANQKFYEFTKTSAEEAVGKSCCDVLRNTTLCDQSLLQKKLFEDTIKTGRSIVNIIQENEPNEIHWEVTRSPIKSESSEIENIMIVWHRITERVRLSREIQSAENKFKSFIDSALDWISIKDLDGRYIIVNPVVAKAYNMTPEDFAGKYPKDILDVGLADNISKHDMEVINSGVGKSFREDIVVNGQTRHFQFERFPLKDWNGNIIGVCAIGRDITKEIILQNQLIHSEKLAALGKLAAGVAHEINNPLTGILSYSEDLLQNQSCCDEVADDLKVIIRETLRCRDIVRNLLDFSRQDRPSLEKNDVNNIVNMTLDLLKKLPQFKNIQIKPKLSSNVPLVLADLKQIEQVILNLFINAAEAMKYTGIINIKTVYDESKEMALIEVEDSGPGIPDSMISKIFEPFFSTKNTSGLGLAVCRGIIERHNGKLSVRMSFTGGAVFTVSLPVIKDNYT